MKEIIKENVNVDDTRKSGSYLYSRAGYQNIVIIIIFSEILLFDHHKLNIKFEVAVIFGICFYVMMQKDS